MTIAKNKYHTRIDLEAFILMSLSIEVYDLVIDTSFTNIDLLLKTFRQELHTLQLMATRFSIYHLNNPNSTAGNRNIFRIASQQLIPAFLTTIG